MNEKIFKTEYGAILVSLDEKHKLINISGATGSMNIPYSYIFQGNVMKVELIMAGIWAAFISSITILILCVQ